jgi:uncharacterized protein (DUF305 family)
MVALAATPIMFLQMMIPHHQQAVDISNLALTKSSDTELAALKNATGKKFDQLWLAGMTGHHEGALHMTTMIQDAKNPAIKTFGQNILIAQTAQINQMATMIKRLS